MIKPHLGANCNDRSGGEAQVRIASQKTRDHHVFAPTPGQYSYIAILSPIRAYHR